MLVTYIPTPFRLLAFTCNRARRSPPRLTKWEVLSFPHSEGGAYGRMEPLSLLDIGFASDCVQHITDDILPNHTTINISGAALTTIGSAHQVSK